MIKHIVCWKLKESALGRNRKENAEVMKNKLNELKDNIKEIKEMEIGINIEGLYDGNWDLVLSTTFETTEDLEIYQNHAEHEKVKQFVKEVRSERACVDFKI